MTSSRAHSKVMGRARKTKAMCYPAPLTSCPELSVRKGMMGKQKQPWTRAKWPELKEGGSWGRYQLRKAVLFSPRSLQRSVDFGQVSRLPVGWTRAELGSFFLPSPPLTDHNGHSRRRPPPLTYPVLSTEVCNHRQGPEFCQEVHSDQTTHHNKFTEG